MSDQIAFRYKKGEPGIIGIPARDITVAEFEAMRPDQRRKIKGLAAYVPLPAEEIDDPLRSLTNEEYAKLAPSEKAARTRAAKQAAEQGGDKDGGAEEGR